MNPPDPLAVFVSPALAWAGLLAMSVPILIHLLSRRRLRRVRWAAMDFLLQAAGRNRRRLRFEELILLTLRCLAVLLAGLMTARWFTEPSAIRALDGGAGPTRRFVLIDDSLSMGLRVGEPPGGGGTIAEDRDAGSVFDLAARVAEDTLRRWRRQAPQDPVTVMRTSAPSEPLCRAVPLESLDVAALGEQLANAGPSNLPARFPSAFRALQALIESDRSGRPALVHVISDFRRIDWPPEAAPAAPLADAARAGAPISLVLVDVGREARVNLSVEELRLEGAPAVAGVGTRMVARVANRGMQSSAPGTMRIHVGDAVAPPQPLPSMAPGQAVDLTFEIILPRPGGEAVGVELPPDALAADNAAVRGLEVLPSLRVLVADGEPAGDPYDDEVFLLATALRPEGPQFSGNEVTVVGESEFESLDFADYHLVIAANLTAFDEQLAARLEAFVAGGGGLLLFAGDQVDVAAWNRVLGREGRGLLPARLGEAAVVSDGRPGRRLSVADGLHPLTRRLLESGDALLSGPLVHAWMTAVPAEAVAASPVSTATSSAPAGEQARTLLALDEPDGPPLLIERAFGAGRVALVTTSADKEWNTLADHPLYVVLAMELASHLARRPADQGRILAGEPIRLVLDPARYRPEAMLRTPGFPAEPAVPLGIRTDEATGRPALQWGGTQALGPYELLLTTVAGSTEKRVVGVNPDPHESDLSPADRDAVLAGIAGLEGISVRFATADEPGDAGDRAIRREWWRHVLAALVAVLMMEQAAAWWFGGRRHVGRLRELLGIRS